MRVCVLSSEAQGQSQYRCKYIQDKFHCYATDLQAKLIDILSALKKVYSTTIHFSNQSYSNF